MGVMDFLFGSDPEIMQEQVDKLTPEQKEMLNQMMGTVSPQLGQAFDTPSFLEGISPSEQAYYDAFDPAASAKMWDETYGASYDQAFSDVVLPNTMSKLAGSRLYSSGAEKTLGTATSNFAIDKARTRGGFLAGEQDKRRGALGQKSQNIFQKNMARWNMGGAFDDGTFNPMASPYWGGAMNLLGMNTFDTIGGVVPGQPGLRL